MTIDEVIDVLGRPRLHFFIIVIGHPLTEAGISKETFQGCCTT